jgi:hypothetical protein
MLTRGLRDVLRGRELGLCKRDTLLTQRALFGRVGGNDGLPAGVERQAVEGSLAAATVNQHADTNRLGTDLPYRREHLANAATGGQDVIHDQYPLVSSELEPASEVTTAAAFAVAFREYAVHAKLSGHLIADDDATRCRPGYHINPVWPKVVSYTGAQLLGIERCFQDSELLQINVGVATGSESKVPIKDSPCGAK